MELSTGNYIFELHKITKQQVMTRIKGLRCKLWIFSAVICRSVGRDGSVGIACYYMLRAGRSGDRIPVGARFFVPVQADPGAYPASCTMGNGSFPG
jgi:hypothetical protein